MLVDVARVNVFKVQYFDSCGDVAAKLQSLRVVVDYQQLPVLVGLRHDRLDGPNDLILMGAHCLHYYRDARVLLMCSHRFPHWLKCVGKCPFEYNNITTDASLNALK